MKSAHHCVWYILLAKAGLRHQVLSGSHTQGNIGNQPEPIWMFMQAALKLSLEAPKSKVWGAGNLRIKVARH